MKNHQKHSFIPKIANVVMLDGRKQEACDISTDKIFNVLLNGVPTNSVQDMGNGIIMTQNPKEIRTGLFYRKIKNRPFCEWPYLGCIMFKVIS